MPALKDVVNPLLLAVLHSRAGPLVGRRLACLAYVGARTGLVHQLVVRYSLDGAQVRIQVGRPDTKTWWRNFLVPRLLALRLAGVSRRGTARAVREGSAVLVVVDLIDAATPPLGAGTASRQ